MVINLLVNVIMSVIATVFQIFPVVTLNDIPVIGTSIRSALVYAVSLFNSAIETVPYLEIVWHTFVYVVIPLEVLFLILKFFLGSRHPTNDIN